MGSATAHHQVLSRSVKLTAFDPGGLHAGAPHAHHEAGRAREFWPTQSGSSLGALVWVMRRGPPCKTAQRPQCERGTSRAPPAKARVSSAIEAMAPVVVDVVEARGTGWMKRRGEGGRLPSTLAVDAKSPA